MFRIWATLAGLVLIIGTAAASDLHTPAPLTPADGAVIPKNITFTWAPVKGAASYAIEIDCFHCCEREKWCSDVRGMGQVFPHLTNPTYNFNFYGNQPGRWRVWAVDKQGRESEKSPWRRFACVSSPADGSVTPAAQPPEPASGVYRIGNGVSPPKAVYSPNPGYTDAARKAKVNGIVVLGIVVGADGLVKAATVRRSLRDDLDEGAIRTVKTWRFDPARKDGQPVPVEISVEVNFATR